MPISLVPELPIPHDNYTNKDKMVKIKYDYLKKPQYFQLETVTLSEKIFEVIMISLETNFQDEEPPAVRLLLSLLV